MMLGGKTRAGHAIAVLGLVAVSCAPSSGRPPKVPLHAPEAPGTSSSIRLAVADGSALPTAPSPAEPVEMEDRLEAPAHPAAHELSDEELARHVAEDLPSLGCMSVGKPNGGALVNGVQMPEGEQWELVSPSRAWATRETIAYLIRAVERVNQQFPEATHPLYIGHLSREGGGPLRPHRSHQSGRDVDISYYYKPDMNPGWYQRASARTLDLPRTWALIRALVTETDVQYMFIDRSVQRVLKRHAASIGEDPAWLDQVFQFRSRHPEPIIRHAWGHATHIHVRFYNPKAQRLAQRAFEHLAEQDIITPGRHYARYEVQPGEDIRDVARRFGTSPDAIRRMNGKKTYHLKPGRIYAIPSRYYVRQVTKLAIPPRRLPPPPRGGDPRSAHAR